MIYRAETGEMRTHFKRMAKCFLGRNHTSVAFWPRWAAAGGCTGGSFSLPVGLARDWIQAVKHSTWNSADNIVSFPVMESQCYKPPRHICFLSCCWGAEFGIREYKPTFGSVCLVSCASPGLPTQAAIYCSSLRSGEHAALSTGILAAIWSTS